MAGERERRPERKAGVHHVMVELVMRMVISVAMERKIMASQIVFENAVPQGT